MEETMELSDHSRELAQQAQAYHEVRGEIQGVIRYMEIEQDLIAGENDVLEEYLAYLEDAMVKYANNKEELAKLQAQHQEYSLRLEKNKTDIENLTVSIKEQYAAIRKMEIDLRNTILKAIEDREAKEERMLQGRIKMENEIINIQKKRYEKERDQILETAEIRKKALEDEKDAIDELLAAKKKQEQTDERLAEIAELEAKIARISADPTRQKEAIELRKKLSELRREQAWEDAENEAEAQKKALDAQIENIEDYKENVTDYYDELLNDPNRLLGELSDMLDNGDDETILEWLKAHSDDFGKATDATKQMMVNTWEDTLRDMRGGVELFWDEVEAIIEQGDEYIIQFLKDNSAEYAEAGKLQAEAYVDGWREQLNALHLAYKKIDGEIKPIEGISITTTSLAGFTTTGGSSSSGSGGGGSRSSSGSPSTTTSAPRSLRDKSGSRSIMSKNDLTGTSGGARGGGGYSSSFSVNAMFADGGMDTFTGLAMMHGTPQDPEAVLNPGQTKLFQRLVESLEMIPRINIPFFRGVDSGSFAGGTTVGDVTVNVTVESLDSKTDIEDAADKLGNAFLRRIQKGTSVSGVRFGNR